MGRQEGRCGRACPAELAVWLMSEVGGVVNGPYKETLYERGDWIRGQFSVPSVLLSPGEGGQTLGFLGLINPLLTIRILLW